MECRYKNETPDHYKIWDDVCVCRVLIGEWPVIAAFLSNELMCVTSGRVDKSTAPQLQPRKKWILTTTREVEEVDGCITSGNWSENDWEKSMSCIQNLTRRRLNQFTDSVSEIKKWWTHSRGILLSTIVVILSWNPHLNYRDHSLVESSSQLAWSFYRGIHLPAIVASLSWHLLSMFMVWIYVRRITVVSRMSKRITMNPKK